MRQLRFLLSVPFVLILLFAISIFTYLAYSSSKQSVDILLNKLAQESDDGLQAHINSLLNESRLSLSITTEAVESGQFKAEDLFKKPEQFFMSQYRLFLEIGDVFFGRFDGAIVGVSKEQGEYTLRITTVFPKRDFFKLEQNGSRGAYLKSNDYSALARDWFISAKDSNETEWTKVYVLKNKDELGIAISKAVYTPNKEFAGVFGVHLTLENLSDFLLKTKISEHALTYIIERNGNLVATSCKQKLFTQDDANKSNKLRINAEKVDNKLISTSYQIISQDKASLADLSKINIKTIEIDGKNYIVWVSNYKSFDGLDWLIINVVNEDDFIGDVKSLIIKTATLGFLIFILVVAVGFIMANKIANPINILSKKAKKVSSGDFGTILKTSSVSVELSELMVSFNTMSRQLEEYFHGFKKLNNELEQKVVERTSELSNLMVDLEDLNRELNSSIEYAALIQSAIISHENVIKPYFSSCFAVWQAKDCVGGDMIMFEHIVQNDSCLIFVFDCTGHGVPGAFVSMLVKAVQQSIMATVMQDITKDISPALILATFNKTIKSLLKQNNQDTLSNAGFDGAVAYFSKSKQIMRFAAGYSHVIFARGDDIQIMNGDKHSIGYRTSNVDFVFTDKEITTQPNDIFIFSTDGLYDQNGGAKDLPFGKKRVVKMLQEYKDEPFNEIKEIILYELGEYQGSNARNDDIAFVGVKI
ncbi:MAG: hypothetical protein RL154_1439 [Pseudomonadota bacterium]